MIKFSRCLVLIIIALWSVNANSQNSQVMYYMRIPQNRLINPAFRPANSFNLGLPLLSSINGNINNNFLELMDVLAPNDTIDMSEWPPKSLDTKRIADRMKKHNSISADVNIQLLGLGFMIGKDWNIFIDVIDRVEAKAILPKDMSLFISGFDLLQDQTVSFSGMKLRAQYYREYGLGISKNVTEKLRIGARAKLITGIACLNFDNRAFDLTRVGSTLPVSISVNADASLQMNGLSRLKAFEHLITSSKGISGISNFLKNYLFSSFLPNSDDNFLNNSFSNLGLGVDIGAVYDFNKMLSVSASVTDLGFINWKDDLKSYDIKKSFEFQAVSLEDIVNDNFSADSLMGDFIDTLKNGFIQNSNPLAYKTYLSPGISIGANLNLFSVFTVGVLSQSKIYGGQIKEALTLSGNAYFGKIFSASLSYTIANYSFNNLGFGMSFKAGPGQIYFIADNIPLTWNKITLTTENGSSPLPMPDKLNLLNLRMGFNISFGKVGKVDKNGNKKIDKPMIIVE